MVSFHISVTAIAVVLLSGCYGDFATCRTDCQPGYHRNAFCDCDKNQTSTIPPNIYGPIANRDFHWEPTSYCSLNNIVYLYNVSGKDVWATYSYRDRSGNRYTDQRFVPHGFRGYNDAVKFNTVLGYQYYNEPECPTADFQLVRSSLTKSVSELEPKKYAIAQILRMTEEESIIKFEAISASLGRATGENSILNAANSNNNFNGKSALSDITIKEIKRFDCPKECNGASPSINCLKGSPPDQMQILRIHDSLTKPVSGKEIELSYIKQIVGGGAVSCKRGNIKLTATGGLSNGESCAYPFYLNSNESLPSIVLHLPATVSANRLNKNNLSMLEFSALEEAPVLVFRASDINSIWGGKVFSISTDQDGVYYQTHGGCIALEITK